MNSQLPQRLSVAACPCPAVNESRPISASLPLLLHNCWAGGTSGVVDCTPPKSEHVWLGFNDALVSELLNIHRGHAVVVRPVATVRALVFVRVLAPVCFTHQPACRTGLARVPWVNRNDGMTSLCGLVFDHLSELVERPTDLHVPVALTHLFGGAANAAKVFQRKKRGLELSVDECLRDLMIHVPHPTVFSLADFPEPAPCAARPLLLEGGAHLLVTLAFPFHLPPVVETVRPSLSYVVARNRTPISTPTTCCGWVGSGSSTVLGTSRSHFPFLFSSLAVPNLP